MFIPDLDETRLGEGASVEIADRALDKVIVTFRFVMFLIANLSADIRHEVPAMVPNLLTGQISVIFPFLAGYKKNPDILLSSKYQNRSATVL